MHESGTDSKPVSPSEKKMEPSGADLAEGIKGPQDIPQWYRVRQFDLVDFIEELGKQHSRHY